jgi:hypothetical protein
MNFTRLVVTTALAGLIAPAFAASPYCVAVNGGFGTLGGTSFVARGFDMPDPSKCTPWSGYTKTASTVILTTSGTACISDDGTVLTVSVASADPAYVAGQVSDYIQLCPAAVTNCSIGGQDSGFFAGSAAEQPCTDDLLDLPAMHD